MLKAIEMWCYRKILRRDRAKSEEVLKQIRGKKIILVNYKKVEGII